MFQLIIGFLVLALIAAFLGMPAVAVISAQLAKTLFFVFIALFLISAIFSYFYRPGPPPVYRP